MPRGSSTRRHNFFVSKDFWKFAFIGKKSKSKVSDFYYLSMCWLDKLYWGYCMGTFCVFKNFVGVSQFDVFDEVHTPIILHFWVQSAEFPFLSGKLDDFFIKVELLKLHWIATEYKDYVLTCMMAMLSRIQACRDEARSLKEASFFWPSASKRGCPEGGSGKTSYNWDTYVMIDFSSGSGVSTSANMKK